MKDVSDGYSSIHLGHKRVLLAVAVALVLLLVASTITVLATTYCILNQGDSHKIGDAIYRGYNPVDASGSGVFDSFLRIADANSCIVQGYNTGWKTSEGGPNTHEFPQAKDPFTESKLLSAIPVTTDPDYPGIYREFQLDINQSSGEHLSLDEVEIYLTLNRNLTGYPFATAPNTATLVYELDAGGANHNVVLNYDLAAGSGKRDLILRIPDARFQGVAGLPYCQYQAATCSTYVVLYTRFGGDDSGTCDGSPPYCNDDGGEEWGVQLYDLATKSGYKFNDLNANGEWDQPEEPGLSGWRIYLDVNGNGQYDNGEPFDDTDSTGYYEIVGIVPNPTVTDTWTIREVPQTNWVCSYPDPCYYDEYFGPGEDHTDNNFGNYLPPGYKFGYKYEDKDADGDITEDTNNPLSGWTISVLELDNTFVVSDTTDATGYYSFTLAPGDYKVCEGVQAGWTQSYPTSDHPEYVACPNGTAGYSITVISNQRLGPNNFGNWTTATKSGYKYEDMDGDGNIAEDTGHPLSNWTIKVYDTGGSEVASTTTSASGYYSFTLNPGSYRVCEDLQAGWTQSYPTSGFACANGTTGYAITLQSGDHDRENNFGNYVKPTKSGYKYEDMDGDGDITEDTNNPLSGWTIRVYDAAGNEVASTTTNASGYYTFTLEPGSYRVCEDVELDWTQSYPTSGYACANNTIGYSITLQSGDNDTGNNFGNYLQPTKSGYKYEDMDGDGDITEDMGHPLSGWTIRVYDADWTEVDSTTTGVSGWYWFRLDPGSYRVCEDLQAGWTQSYPTDAHAEYVECPDGTVGYSITLQSGDNDTGNNFGNYRKPTKSGYKYEDMDGDGDITEDTGHPLSGWTIRVYDAAGNEVASTTTNASGYYTFTLEPGSYKVCEDVQAGWTQSYPTTADGCHDITLQSGDNDTGNNFGNYRKPTKSGYKYEDMDGDGDITEDTGHPLSGWTIRVYDAAGNEVDSTTTDGNGYYEFTLEPGSYKVCEDVEAGWTQSYPTTADGCYDITLQSGDNDTGNNFGNYVKVDVTACKLEDVDGDPETVDDRVPVPDWPVALTVDGVVVDEQLTGDQGCYTWYDLQPGVVYDVHEDLLPGWFNWTPLDHVFPEAESGGVYVYKFLNSRYGVKSGHKWHDLDADGEWDGGEPGLEDWTIQLLDDAGNVLASTTTDTDGLYMFADALLVPGVDYLVCEVLEDDWYQSFPTDAEGELCPNGTYGYLINLESGEEDTDNDFGNYTLGSKSGHKWHDADGDGEWDPGEAGLPGWTIDLFDDAGNLLASATTDGNGFYGFDDLMPGQTYRVCEELPAEWEQTFPESGYACANGTTGYEFTMTSGAAHEDNDFGNVLRIKLEIVKYRPHGDVRATWNFWYYIDVTNVGSVTASQLWVTDTLPSEIATYSVLLSNGGVYDPDTNTATWYLPSLGPGHSAQFWIRAQTYSWAVGLWMRNIVCVDAAGLLAPVCATDTAYVYPPPVPPPPTPTPTATPTNTPLPTATPTATPEPTVTPTPTEEPPPVVQFNYIYLPLVFRNRS